MSDPKYQETYYEVLRIDRHATITEIVAAYHSAKAAFSKDSIATYSLFSESETDMVLSRLEAAYLTLSNLDKKRDYDRLLLNQSSDEAVPMGTMEKQTTESFQTPSPQTVEQEATDPNICMDSGNHLSEYFLREIRERRALSIEDVSRITKIPAKFLKAIEDNNKKTVPAKVYLQGFVKNLANLYKMDPQETVKAYLAILDKQDN